MYFSPRANALCFALSLCSFDTQGQSPRQLDEIRDQAEQNSECSGTAERVRAEDASLLTTFSSARPSPSSPFHQVA